MRKIFIKYNILFFALCLFSACGVATSEPECTISQIIDDEINSTPKVIGIKVIPKKDRSYFKIDEKIDFSEFEVYKVFDDDSLIQIENYFDDIVFEVPDLSTEGVKFINFKYNGFETSYKIYIYDININDIFNIGLPVFNIITENNEEPSYEVAVAPEGYWGEGIKNATKVKGRLVITQNNVELYDSGEYNSSVKNGMTIKVRGNTSALADKKPYKIKLQQKENLLFDENPENKNKEWVLLANTQNLNTSVGFALSEIIGFNYIPEYRYVNLIINNEYKGLYVLCESIQKSVGTIDVSDTGYIIERDSYWWNEPIYFKGENDSGFPMRYTFKYPDADNITQEQLEYITEYITNAERSLEDNNWLDYFDADSFAKWLLVHDILGTYDSGGSNIYITKYDNSDFSKLIMTTPWDFDSNYGINNRWSNIHSASYFYFSKLCEKEDFKELYSEQFFKVKNDLLPLMHEKLIYLNISDINLSRKYNSIRWNRSFNLAENDISIMESWIEKRIQFISDHLSDF